MSTTETSKWLDGRYAPLPAEVTATELEVIGSLPVELEGRYLRNGPNPMHPVDPATHHWFLGHGMVHGVRLGDGRADWYRARSVGDTSLRAVDGPPAADSLGSPNTNVIGLGARTLAIVEAGGRPVELTYELETLAAYDFDGTLPLGFTAHPKVDPATGDLHAIAYHWTLPHLQYLVASPDGRVQQVEAIEVPDGPMAHDCSITERWMVVYDLPVTFDLDQAMAGTPFPYRWNDAHQARVGLLPLHGRAQDVRWFEVASCYVFHPLNAYDDGDQVVLDVARHPRMFDTSPLGPDDGAPMLWRWTIDTVTGAVTEEQLSDQALEFPRVDERLVGRPHRWGYAVEIGRDGDENGWGGGLVRIDGKSGATEVIDLGPGRTSGEWVMVPRHADAAEDDGWLMALVHDAGSDRSELVVLPAADPGAGPEARVLLPTRVPVGFHGNWVPDPA